MEETPNDFWFMYPLDLMDVVLIVHIVALPSLELESTLEILSMVG